MAYMQESTELIALIILAFSALFLYTSRLERCWYRRYLLPLMVASFALVLPRLMEKLIVLVSAFLIYYGYRGLGRKAKAAKKGK